MPMSRHRLSVLAAGLSTLVLVGCGSSATSSHAPATGASTATTRRSTSGQVASSATGSSAPSAGQMSVTIKNYAYRPARITIKAGTKVTWTNRDNANHTVTADSHSFDPGNLDPGQSKSMTFSKPGSYPYHCDYHPFMHGKVIVR